MTALDQTSQPRRRLVGRADALELLDGIIDAMRRGSAEPVVIVGMLQTGRTALLSHLVEEASDHGVLTALVTGDTTQSIRASISTGVLRAIDALAARRPGASGLGQMRGAVVDFRASTASGLALTCYEMLHQVGRSLRDLGTGLIVGIDDLDVWTQPEVEAVVRASVAAADRGGMALLVPSLLPNPALAADGQSLCLEVPCNPFDAAGVLELAAGLNVTIDPEEARALADESHGRPGHAAAALRLLHPDGPRLPSAARVAATTVAGRIDSTWCAGVCEQLDPYSMATLRAVAALSDRTMPTAAEVAGALGVGADDPRFLSARRSLGRARLVCSPDGIHLAVSYELLRRFVGAGT